MLQRRLQGGSSLTSSSEEGIVVLAEDLVQELSDGEGYGEEGCKQNPHQRSTVVADGQAKPSAHRLRDDPAAGTAEPLSTHIPAPTHAPTLTLRTGAQQ